MAKVIQFTKADKVNNKTYKKGDTLSVSNSIYEILTERGSAKDFVKPKSKSVKE